MVLAHTLGAGGPDIELLLVAVAMMSLGVVFYFQKTVKPVVSVVLMVGAVALGAGAFALGGSSPSGAGMDVTIRRPDPGAVVAAGRPLNLDVDVDGGTIASSPTGGDGTAGHLHVFVDGKLVDMPTTATPELRLRPGSHTVSVEFVDARHVSFSPAVVDEVKVMARSGAKGN